MLSLTYMTAGAFTVSLNQVVDCHHTHDAELIGTENDRADVAVQGCHLSRLLRTLGSLMEN